MVTAGTISTLRVNGLPAGYPAEIENSDFKVRYVDSSIEVMSDLEIPLLKALGGPTQFQTPTQKFEWQMRDTWSDRDNLGAQLTAGGTTLTLDAAAAHRYPRGTVLKCEDELIWVSAQASTTTLTVVRGYTGTTDATHANATEFRVAGFSEVEGTDFVMRGSALHTQAYNWFSIFKTGSGETWINSQQQSYVRSGPTMPEMMADNISQYWVGVEAQLIEGQRYAGTGVEDPPMSGGIRYFGTSGNGANVVDAGGARLSKAIIDQALDAAYNKVGPMNMSRTILAGLGVQRTLYRDYIQPFVRIGAGGTADPDGLYKSFDTEYGKFNILGPYKRIPTDELWIVNPANIEVGTYGSIGRLHEGDLSTQGDYTKKFLFAMTGNKVKGIPGMCRIHNFTVE